MPGAPIIIVLGEQKHLRRGPIAPLFQTLRNSRQLRVMPFHSTASVEPHHWDEANAVVVFCDGLFFIQVGPYLRSKRSSLPVVVVCPEGFLAEPTEGVTYLPGCKDYPALHEALYKAMGIQ